MRMFSIVVAALAVTAPAHGQSAAKEVIGTWMADVTGPCKQVKLVITSVEADNSLRGSLDCVQLGQGAALGNTMEPGKTAKAMLAGKKLTIVGGTSETELEYANGQLTGYTQSRTMGGRTMVTYKKQ